MTRDALAAGPRVRGARHQRARLCAWAEQRNMAVLPHDSHYVDAYIKPMNAVLEEGTSVTCKRRGLKIALSVDRRRC